MASVKPAGERLAREIYGDAAAELGRYVDILTTTGIKHGLVGPREADRAWERHIFNSTAIAGLIDIDRSAIDVGSGAGLPGIPLALIRPDLRMTLLEPLLRRFSFLVETVNDLDLAERVSVIRARAEDHPSRYGIVVARAVAPLDRLLSWCDPLRSPGGILLAIKGRNAGMEVERAQRVLRERRLTAELLEASADPRLESVSVVRVTDA
jgi:16S rRNA (guanine527-N7)-methyltransferase